jgi:hypothetical protein
MGPPLFQFGKLIAIAGIFLVAVETLLMAGSRLGLLGSIGRMPGAIAYKGKNVSFYFPLVTCLTLSVLVTLVLS